MFQKKSVSLPLRRAGIASLLGLLLFFAIGAKANSAPPIFATGYNHDGELGDGSNIDRSVPQPIGVGGDTSPVIVAIAAGYSHSLALTADGSVYSWGLNDYGQLGDGAVAMRTTPAPVKLADGTPLTHIIAISGGNSHSLALTADGKVYAWGFNVNGQLGDGTTTQRDHPILIPNFTNVVAIAAGGYHSLALTGNGKVYSWGYNSYGQLGSGAKDFNAHSAPAAVPGLTGITAIAGGGYHSLALSASGAVFAWGQNAYGQLGDGTTTSRFSATAVLASGDAALTGVSAISAGVYHSVVLKAGTVFGFGYNATGQVGDGTTLNRSFPVSTGLSNAQTITAGGYHTLALSGGGLYAWGQNVYGELGDGAKTNRSAPTAIAAGGAVGFVAGGGNHTLFVQAPSASVSGALAFEGISAVSNNQGVTFLFVPTDGSPRLTYLASVAPDGAFTIPGVPRNAYTVWIKGTKYLAATAAADASAGNVSGLTAAQGAGDANNDNFCDTSDFGVLVGSYGSDAAVPGSGYDETTDFNGDGFVDTTDFGLLVGEYGSSGAPIP